MRRGGPRNQHIKTSLKGSIYLTFGKMKKWWWTCQRHFCEWWCQREMLLGGIIVSLLCCSTSPTIFGYKTRILTQNKSETLLTSFCYTEINPMAIMNLPSLELWSEKVGCKTVPPEGKKVGEERETTILYDNLWCVGQNNDRSSVFSLFGTLSCL